MQTIAGVYTSKEDALTTIKDLEAAGIPSSEINLLTPSGPAGQVEAVPSGDYEGKGMAGAVGAIIGGSAGLGMAPLIASALIPGVGIVSALGIAAMAILGIGGATAGAAAGNAIEGGDEKIPKDDLYLYEDALRQGRSVVFATVGDDNREKADAIINSSGAETIDAAKDQWWSNLRNMEAQHYSSTGLDFESSETRYRKGFESALHPAYRGKQYDEASKALRERNPDIYEDDAYKQGYERGRKYYDENWKTKR